MIKFNRNIEKTEDTFNIPNIDIIKVQCNSAGTVTVEGSTDKEHYIALTGINDKGFEVINQIISTGLYSFDGNGLVALKIKKSSPDILVNVEGVGE